MRLRLLLQASAFQETSTSLAERLRALTRPGALLGSGGGNTHGLPTVTHAGRSAQLGVSPEMQFNTDTLDEISAFSLPELGGKVM